MTALILAAQLLAAVSCATPAPGPSWVCQDGGWLPPGHPAIRPPVAAPEPPPAPPTGTPQAPLVLQFQVGRTYRRATTGVVLHIAAIGAAKNGLAVYAAECLNEVAAEQCWYPGAARLILANASASGWEEVP